MLDLCQFASDEFEQRIANARDHAVPFARFALAEQTRGRIPRAVIPVEQPAPIRHMRQQYPDRLSQRSREMRDSGVDRYHEIQMRYQRRGVGKILKLMAEMNDAAPLLERRPVGGANFFLQADKRGVDVHERQQELYKQIADRGERVVKVAMSGFPMTDEMKARVLSTLLTLMNTRENMDRSAMRQAALKRFA